MDGQFPQTHPPNAPHATAEPVHLEVSRLLLDEGLGANLPAFILHARKSLFILQYHFRVPAHPSHPISLILDALAAAAGRGIQINILLNHPRRVRRAATDHGALSPRLKHQNIRIRHMPDDQTLHCKAILRDSSDLLIGSHNLTRAGLLRSHNASIIVRDYELAGQFQKWADFLWTQAHTSGLALPFHPTNQRGTNHEPSP